MRRRKPDKIFLWITGALVLVGLFILASASIGLLTRSGAGFYHTLSRQILIGLVGGGVLFLAAMRIDYKKWQKFSLPFFIFTFLLTLLVFIPGVGSRYGGATRWLDFKFFSFQPSELLKLSFVIYLSAWIASRKGDIKSFRFGLMPFLVMIGFVGILLIMQPDVGTLGVIAVTSLLVFFLGGGKYTQVALIVLLGVGLLCGLILLEPYRMARFTVFLNPDMDSTGIGYHLKQSLISFGSGGLFGRGFGMSLQKFKYLPEPIGDSVFAVFGEEFGFIGSMSLIGLFLSFLYRGFYIALRAPDDFGRLLGSGIVILIVLQSFMNVAAMVGLMPLTGLPLVFVSKGGSAMVVALVEVGILLNISKYI